MGDMTYYGGGDSGSFWNDYIQQGNEENSWWAEEWSNALGDNYPAPDSYDPEGNPGYTDHNGYFHDYNSGMSDYEVP
jgi:hypothetical protein